MYHRMLRLLALFAALGLVLSACGDDDDSTATDDGAAQEDGEASDDDGSSDVGEEAEDAAEEAAEDAIASEVGEECAFLGKFAATGFDGAFDDVDPFNDGGASFQTLAEQFDEVADAAPDEIKDAFSTLAEGISTLAEALEGVDMSDPESFDPAAFEAIDDETYVQAGEEVEAWLAENCPGAGM